MGDVSMSKELLEIVKPIIEPQILLREQNALEKGIQKGIKKGGASFKNHSHNLYPPQTVKYILRKTFFKLALVY